MAGILIAILSGALMSIQGIFNTQVTEQTSLWVASGWVQLTALVTCIVAWCITGKSDVAVLFQVEHKYALLGGVIGAFITVTVIRGMDALGPAKATMLIVVAQLLVSYLVELAGIFNVDRQPFSWRKGLGMLIALVGVVLFQWK